jgi:hypothetical protein
LQRETACSVSRPPVDPVPSRRTICGIAAFLQQHVLRACRLSAEWQDQGFDSSTRRFFAFPSSVVFGSSGFVSPNPSG